MSPRKTILRELDQLHDGEGDGRYTRPSTMPGYGGKAAKYQEAVNGLLKDRLIDGKKDEEGRMALALNPHRISEVRKEASALVHPADDLVGSGGGSGLGRPLPDLRFRPRSSETEH